MGLHLIQGFCLVVIWSEFTLRNNCALVIHYLNFNTKLNNNKTFENPGLEDFYSLETISYQSQLCGQLALWEEGTQGFGFCRQCVGLFCSNAS